MAETPYAHLHVHTEYSMLDGAARLKELFKEVAAQGMTHVAMTDHGNMFGAAEFHRQAKEAGITPVIGIEAYVAPEHRRQQEPRPVGPAAPEDQTTSPPPAPTCTRRSGPGTTRACTTSSSSPRRSFAEGWLTKYARMDKEIIAEHAAGLMATTGCPLRRRADPAAARPVGGGAPGRRRVPGHLRQGELLPRADGPRPRHRAPGPRRACSRSAGSSASRRWSPTTPTTARSPTPRRTSCCCASRPARPWPTRTGSSSTAPATTSSRPPRCTRSAPTTSGERAAATPSCSSPTGSTRSACSSSST